MHQQISQILSSTEWFLGHRTQLSCRYYTETDIGFIRLMSHMRLTMSTPL